MLTTEHKQLFKVHHVPLTRVDGTILVLGMVDITYTPTGLGGGGGGVCGKGTISASGFRPVGDRIC